MNLTWSFSLFSFWKTHLLDSFTEFLFFYFGIEYWFEAWTISLEWWPFTAAIDSSFTVLAKMNQWLQEQIILHWFPSCLQISVFVNLFLNSDVFFCYYDILIVEAYKLDPVNTLVMLINCINRNFFVHSLDLIFLHLFFWSYT